ncbi:MAG TPA: ABC transporter ATP-binding protein [Candidatus Thermoplasmatota archaeon]|nr:ABC transporter ATP-binding protein [Candidatus Thermoplasmatota archaeon]
MIEAEHLSKRFEDGHVAVEDSHFTIRPGEALGLLGPNGAGKTTTVHMLLGHLRPSGGRARIHGIDIHEHPIEAKRHVGYVSENVLLYGSLTALQNLRFFSRLSGRDASEEELAALLARVGLAHAARRPVEAFSKGMRQRLGIAIALAKDPPALVMDEPTSGLDPVGARELGDLIVGLRKERKAILLVTHDVFRITELVSSVMVMRDGRSVPLDAAALEDLEAVYRRTMQATPEVLHA